MKNVNQDIKNFYRRTKLTENFQAKNVNEHITEEYKWQPNDTHSVIKTLYSLKQQLTKLTMKN